MKILTLLPFLLGVVAETTKPNTGDQTLGQSRHLQYEKKANNKDSYSDSQLPHS
jgi:hypothetical protein